MAFVNSIRNYSEKRLIGYTREQLFDVVANVDQYHLFVPYCKKSEVVFRSKDNIKARLEVGIPPLLESYTSNVKLDRPKLINAQCIEGVLFRHLDTRWKFNLPPKIHNPDESYFNLLRMETICDPVSPITGSPSISDGANFNVHRENARHVVGTGFVSLANQTSQSNNNSTTTTVSNFGAKQDKQIVSSNRVESIESGMKVKRCKHGRIIIKNSTKKRTVQQSDDELKVNHMVKESSQPDNRIITPEANTLCPESPLRPVEAEPRENNNFLELPPTNASSCKDNPSTSVLNATGVDTQTERLRPDLMESVESPKERGSPASHKIKTPPRKFMSSRSPERKPSPRRHPDRSPRERHRSRSPRRRERSRTHSRDREARYRKSTSGKRSPRRRSPHRSSRRSYNSPSGHSSGHRTHRHRSPRRHHRSSRSTSSSGSSRTPERGAFHSSRRDSTKNQDSRRDRHSRESEYDDGGLRKVSTLFDNSKSFASIKKSENRDTQKDIGVKDTSQPDKSSNAREKIDISSQPKQVLGSLVKVVQSAASPKESTISARSPKTPSSNDSISSDIYDPEEPIIPISPGDSPPTSSLDDTDFVSPAYHPGDVDKNEDDMPSSAVQLNHQEKYLQKLNRQERVVEEVKVALKPHYQRRAITKEQYKDVLRRAVPKICHSKNGEINPVKIGSLVEAYVQKMKRHKR